MELLLIFLSTGVISYVSAFFLSKHPLISEQGGLSVFAGVFCGTIATAFMVPFPLAYHGASSLLTASSALAFFSVEKSKCPLWLMTIILCFVASVFFVPDKLVFQGLLPFWFDRAVASLLWAGFILMFYRFAEDTNFGIIQTQAIVLAFMVLGFISKNIILNQLMFYDVVLCGAIIGYLFMKRRAPLMEFGRVGALFVGFWLGGFFMMSALEGAWLLFIVMPLFLYLDYLYAGMQEVRAYLTKRTYTLFYFLPKCVVLSSSGFSSFLMKRMLIVAILGVLLQAIQTSFKTMLIMTFFSVIIIVVDTVMRIESWGKPKPRIRDLFRDIRDAGREVHTQVKKGIGEFKNRSK